MTGTEREDEAGVARVDSVAPEAREALPMLTWLWLRNSAGRGGEGVRMGREGEGRAGRIVEMESAGGAGRCFRCMSAGRRLVEGRGERGLGGRGEGGGDNGATLLRSMSAAHARMAAGPPPDHPECTGARSMEW